MGFGFAPPVMGGLGPLQPRFMPPPQQGQQPQQGNIVPDLSHTKPIGMSDIRSGLQKVGINLPGGDPAAGGGGAMPPGGAPGGGFMPSMPPAMPYDPNMLSYLPGMAPGAAAAGAGAGAAGAGADAAAGAGAADAAGAAAGSGSGIASFLAALFG